MSGTSIDDVQVSNGELGLSQCVWCRHRWSSGQRCEAFPEGIPEAILCNHHDHRVPFEGDSGILFEPEEVEIEFVDQDEDDVVAPPAGSPDRAPEPAGGDLEEAFELIELDGAELGDPERPGSPSIRPKGASSSPVE
jgi:hypothetical protein